MGFFRRIASTFNGVIKNDAKKNHLHIPALPHRPTRHRAGIFNIEKKAVKTGKVIYVE